MINGLAAYIEQAFRKWVVKKFYVLAIVLAVLFGGCSAKEFNEGVESITGDVSNVFEEGRDKSGD